MRGRTLAQAVSASRAFLASKPNRYRVSFVTFASQPLQLTPFSSSSGDAETALRSITIDRKTGTTIYDAIVLSAAQLRAEGFPGRVIILITDGKTRRAPRPSGARSPTLDE
jgi:Mg-chelatase subunit ChlD